MLVIACFVVIGTLCPGARYAGMWHDFVEEALGCGSDTALAEVRASTDRRARSAHSRTTSAEGLRCNRYVVDRNVTVPTVPGPGCD